MIQQVCIVSGEPFAISDSDLEFYRKVGPCFGSQSYPIPPPKLSPAERLRRRLAFRQERHLYRIPCAISGKPLVSVFSPDKKLKVIDKSLFSTTDNRKLGREFDFSKPFFDQFSELYRSTYKPNVMHNGEVENCDYSHFVGWLKNAYLCFDTGCSEDLAYSVFVGYCKDSCDCYYLTDSELCYEVVKGDHCYNVLFSSRVKSCNFSAFLDDCIGCSHCLGCTNLRNKEYRIFNDRVSKEAFEQTWNKVFSGSWRSLKAFHERYCEFLLAQPRRPLYHLQTINSSGDDLTGCENVLDSFNCLEARNCRFLHDCYFGTESTYDVNSWGEGMENCYDLSGCGGLRGKTGMVGCLFGTYLYYGGYNLMYCISCLEKSQNLFGCCDLSKREYCILNKQYTRSDYEALVPRIIEHMQQTGEWGQFLPLSVSLFGYNESLAQELFPLEESAARAIGSHWSSYEAESGTGTAVIAAADLPDSLSDVADPGKLVVRDEDTGKPFRFTGSELNFYRRHGLPLPRQSFLSRHTSRCRRLNPRKLYTRTCAKSGEPIVTTYAPDRPEIIYSEEAYLAAVD